MIATVASMIAGLAALLALAADTTPAVRNTKGSTLYVSKRGDNTDGRSWKTAFRTIQGALSAVSDDRGGHRIVVRPDTYVEANLYPAHKGAKEVGYPKFPGHTRVKFTRCRLIVLNFSQPGGTPSGGIIHTPLDGRQLHVDLENCRMMGYKVFSTEGKNPIGYTVKGKVQAYVQFQQPVPAGIERLARWPVELFAHAAPPEVPSGKGPP